MTLKKRTLIVSLKKYQKIIIFKKNHTQRHTLQVYSFLQASFIIIENVFNTAKTFFLIQIIQKTKF